MKPRPAYRKLLTQPHAYELDELTDTCGWRNSEGWPCGLPETNRHHNLKPTTQPAEPAEELWQPRLDIDG